VYYVPDLKTNILSMGQLMEKGYSVIMKDRVLELRDKLGYLITRVEMKQNKMYKLELRCLKLDVEDEVMKWHFRFGHLHFGGLTELVQKEMVRGLPNIEFKKNFCEDCVLGKHQRASFPKTIEYQVKEQLGLVHTDVCGPITLVSFSGKRYFLTFIDDFSRKTWVYFLKEKSEVFGVFKKFKVLIENETSTKIKVVRSDRGGEYTSAKFMRYYEELGIRRFLMASYSPQQNGVVERKNQTILKMVRAMLKGKNMSKEFWAEAVQCAVYVQNRCPHAKLNGETPHEAWSGKKPCVSHLKVFGSVAYAHVPAQQRTKLEDKSKKLVFIGYDEKTKGYKLFNPVTNKVLMIRDVVIDEENKWNNSTVTVKSITTTSGSSETTFGSSASERRNLDNVSTR